MLTNHVIVLKQGQHTERVLYKVQKGQCLKLKLHHTLVGLKTKIFCNYPQRKAGGAEPCFNRHEYYELPWTYSGKEAILTEIDGFASIQVECSGSFRFYCSLPDSEYKSEVCSGYFVVDPTVTLHSTDPKTGLKVDLGLDSICMQTVVTKHLGPVDTWISRLRTCKESGYNMVHFTPVQHLGSSNSAYSIKDQLEVDPRYASSVNGKATWHDVKSVVDQMKTNWDVVSITDVVLNHTSFDSPWIHRHPNAGFNLVNSPHLRSAFVLDRVLWKLTLDVASDKYIKLGIDKSKITGESLEKIRTLLLETIIPQYNIPSYYMADEKKLVGSFKEKLKGLLGAPWRQPDDVPMQLIQDPLYRVYGCTVDMESAVSKFYIQRPNITDYNELINEAVKDFESCLKRLNLEKKTRIEQFLKDAVGNCVANAGYQFLDPNGPKWKEMSEKTPFVWRYFTEHPFSPLPPEKEIESIDDAAVSYHYKACNGWIMGDDPLRNFAEPGSMVYLKRELIVWGDSVKLRFGKGPKDSPYLWDRIQKYCQKTAEIFDGIRLDNCHSTPLHVAEFVVDTCRKVKPNFYVMAELFTGREDIDMIFVNRLGITSLIREAMSTYDCRELGRQIHRYGGRPVGGFFSEVNNTEEDHIEPSLPHALFMDYTHDNQPSAVQKRHPVDLLASAAAVGMGCYGVGSSKGYDDMVPHYIDIVNENRLYPEWSNVPLDFTKPASSQFISSNCGIIPGKKLLNELHQIMTQSSNNFDQVYVDQVTSEVITITRQNSQSHKSVIAAIRTAFDGNIISTDPDAQHSHNVTCLNIPGIVEKVMVEANTVAIDESGSSGKLDLADFIQDEKYINGLKDWTVEIKRDFQVDESKMVKLMDSSDKSISKLAFKKFPPGSVIIFSVSLSSATEKSLHNLQSLLNKFQANTFKCNNDLTNLDLFDFSQLSLVDMNRLLYRCGSEEVADGLGFGPYDVPGYGNLKFCGIAGPKYVMDEARPKNNLGHAIFENIRAGNWLLDYSVSRLKAHAGTTDVAGWMDKVFTEMKHLPRYLIPAYFECFIRFTYNACVQQIMIKLNQEASSYNLCSLKTKLLLGSVQLMGQCRSAPLAPFKIEKDSAVPVSLSAGLPHFSEGIWRNWGRDTFIALRGLLILTNRLDEARNIILSYGATMRHGLIPNLLGGGSEIARYNCRDAFWWWLNSIRHYCSSVSKEQARKLLNERVARIYPTDESPYIEGGVSSKSVTMTLAEIMQEGLEKHVNGIHFVERNAGPKIDEHMKHEGFTVDVKVDLKTGFVCGGNKWNCGTWMDKMGSSDMAGNRGVPATPRDGAPVELQGLCFASIKWISKLAQDGSFPFSAVKLTGTNKGTMSYSEWAEKLSQNFDSHYYIKSDGNSEYHCVKLINKREIYKDTLGSQNPWTDYQLRPNYAVAIAEAPELCNLDNAWSALDTMEHVLQGPLGMKTLDPSDWTYNGCYENDRNDTDYNAAKGFNYHNGPEWLWLSGYFLRAKLQVAKLRHQKVKETRILISQHLARLLRHVDTSAWRGVTELTNENGAYCYHSSPTQAWSFATILELIHELNQN